MTHPLRGHPAPRGPATDGVLLGHATLAALTPLIPLPFVDGMVRDRVLRRMVRSLASLHGVALRDDEVKILADEPSSNIALGMIKGALLAPLKFFLRKTFLVLAGKQIVDLASGSYHRGLLVDCAFANRWCAPPGPRTPAQVRKAIDEVLKAEPIASSPVTRAIGVGFEHSKRGLADLYMALRSRLTGAASPEAVDAAVSDEEGGLGGVVAALRRAISEVPKEHIDRLQGSLRRQLFGDPAAPGITVSEHKEGGEA